MWGSTGGRGCRRRHGRAFAVIHLHEIVG
jgi:hypothetical protein